MAFTLLPAVDVADGRAVRLVRGGADGATTYGDARAAALEWQAAGAPWIHLVDLDAAFGRGSNAVVLEAVIAELEVPVQLSGGIHDDESLDRALASGCDRINLATTAITDPAWCARVVAEHGERIAVALDVRVDGAGSGGTAHRLVARGGTADQGDLWAALRALDRLGCARYVVTDVGRDGTMGGPNLDLYRAVTRATPAAVIASGGIATIGDLVALTDLAVGGAGYEGAGLEGAVVGRAIYAGRFTLPDALDAVGRAGR